MAIIKTLRYPFQASAMVEDPQPGSDYIYFQSDAYSKANLNPYFDTGIVYGTNGVLAATNVWGAPYPTIETGSGWGGILMLSGETTHVKQSTYNSPGDYRTNLDFAPWASMDPNNKVSPMKYFTDGLNNLVYATYNYMNSTVVVGNYYYEFNIRYWSKLNTTARDLATSGYLTAVSTSVATATQGVPGYFFGAANARGSGGFPVYRNPTTNNMIWVVQGSGAAGQIPYAINGASLTPTFSTNPATQFIVLDNADTTNQFIGASYRDSYGLFLQNDVFNDSFQRVIKYIDNSAAVTVQYSTTATSTNYAWTLPSGIVAVPDYAFGAGQSTTGSYYVSTNTSLNSLALQGSGQFYAPVSMTATLAATMIGSIAGTVLTAQLLTSGAIAVGQLISGTNVTNLTTITSVASYNTLTNTGTFNLSASSTVAAGTRIWAALTTTILASILPGYTQQDGGQRNQMYVYSTTPFTPIYQGRLYPGMSINCPQYFIFDTSTFLLGLTTASGISISTSTNVGLPRLNNFGGPIPKYASKTFQDVTTSSARGFYVPFVDSAGKYNPHYFQWNTATDVFSRSTNVVLNHATGTSQASYWLADNFSASGNALQTKWGMQRVWYNEMCTDNNGARYLIFMQLHGAGGVYDIYPTARTFLIYGIGAKDPLLLNFVNAITIPQTPKNIVWLNANKSLLAVICHTATYTYFLNTSGGFQLTGTFPYQFNAVGTDSYGRAWAHDTGPLGWGRIHLLSGVPVNITVVASSSTYTYSGSTSTTTFAVSAFDITGSRMTATINLSVAGSSLVISNSIAGPYATTLTVITNNLSTSTIFGQVIGSGASNINASITI